MISVSRTGKRIVAATVALAIAAPAALAATTSSTHQAVAHIDRSGTVFVTGYDGGAPLKPGH